MLAALLLVAFSSPPAPAPDASAAWTQGAAGGSPFMRAYRNGCIRSLREFTWELSSAVETGDVNRLAALYRWNGMSTRAGYDTMARLGDIVARPLLQVEPVYARPRESLPASPALAAATSPVVGAGNRPLPANATPAGPAATEGPRQVIWEPALPDRAPAPTAPFDPSPAAVHGPPVALRLDQTLADGVTPASTTLRLQRDLGCWWVSM